MSKKVHHGRNVKRLREILGIKQEALASQLGEDWHQRRVSALEEKEVIEEALLQQVAQALKIPVAAIKNFDEEAAINIISSTLHDNAGSVNNNSTLTFNPVDKWLEAIEENKKLYEALLKSEREKVAMLEKLLNEKR